MLFVRVISRLLLGLQGFTFLSFRGYASFVEFSVLLWAARFLSFTFKVFLHSLGGSGTCDFRALAS